MSTVLSTTARHGALALALAVGVAGAVALPAAAAAHGKPMRHHRSGHASTGVPADGGGAVLGPAVKYVRHADGSVHRVR
jgi:hypothetical protein